MSLTLNVEILGEYRKLTNATKGASKQLAGLNKTAEKISGGINGALGAIGVGFSLVAVVNAFKDSTQAAIEDQKSKELLSKALRDNLKLTDDQVDSIEKFIGKTQLATNVTDDNLRPAFQKLAIGTKDVTKAQELLSIALDVSAGTGKNLDTVAQAMARALEGNEGALARLVPSVKNAKDPIQALADTFDGAAAAAAKTDPYAQMEIIFGELQEQVGTALLPILEDFSEWLRTPEGQKKLKDIVDGVIGIITEFTKLTTWISENEDIVKGLGTAIMSIVTATKLLEIASRVNAPLISANYGKMFGWTAAVITALQLIDTLATRIKNEGGLSSVPQGSAGNTFIGSAQGTQPTFSNIGPSVTGFPGTTTTNKGKSSSSSSVTVPKATPLKSSPSPSSPVVINNNVTVKKSVASGPDIAKAINAANRNVGSQTIKVVPR